MAVTTYEGTVKNGQVQLPDHVSLPENSRVYVLVPDAEEDQGVPRLRSPRLADPGQTVEFQKQIITGNADAGV